MRLLSYLLAISLLVGCNKEETTDQLPFIKLNQGDAFTQDGDRIPVGGQIRFGVAAVGGGVPITNLRVKRLTGSEMITELDKGMYIETGGIDTTLEYVKGDAEEETWNIFIMNENRDTASVFLTVLKGEGSAYGEIFHYTSITVGYRSNSQVNYFLDLKSGSLYNLDNVAGHEQDIDLAAFYYISSGKSSPTLTCPAYPSALTWFPEFESWPVKNSTLYDYKTSDNDLISTEQFDAAENDSLLVTGYKPQNVSGLCKFCYTGKVIPFKTANGRYGLVKVVRADEEDNGSIELEVKIQE